MTWISVAQDAKLQQPVCPKQSVASDDVAEEGMRGVGKEWKWSRRDVREKYRSHLTGALESRRFCELWM
uniref:Uncharacterized protein n=1 Tax=Vitis vinifera TaxID=29760 RepID=F6GV88_VITVI